MGGGHAGGRWGCLGRPISSNVTIAVAVSQGMSLRSNGVMAANRVVGHPLSVWQGAYQTTLV